MFAKEPNDAPFLDLKGIEPISLEVFRSLFKVIRFHSQLLFKLTSEKGIYPGQAACLWFINQIPGISQSDLAKKIHVAPPTVTHMLQKLEKTGLIVRKEDEHDQRLSRVYLTEAGMSILDSLNDILAEIINTSLDGLDSDQKHELLYLLDVIGANILRKL